MRAYKGMRIWTDEEDDIIREVYPNGGWEAVAKLTNRRKDAIKGRAHKLKVHMTPERRLIEYQNQAIKMRKVLADKRGATWDGRPEASGVNSVLAMRW